jgi:hypothetical protein
MRVSRPAYIASGGLEAASTAGLPPQRAESLVGDPGLETGATICGLALGRSVSSCKINTGFRPRPAESRTSD